MKATMVVESQQDLEVWLKEMLDLAASSSPQTESAPVNQGVSPSVPQPSHVPAGGTLKPESSPSGAPASAPPAHAPHR